MEAISKKEKPTPIPQMLFDQALKRILASPPKHRKAKKIEQKKK